MGYDPKFHTERSVSILEPSKRKPNRLKEYDYSQTGAYFITICTINREPILCKIIDSDTIVGDKTVIVGEDGIVGDTLSDIPYRDASLDIQHRDAETYPRASSLAQAQFTLSSPTIYFLFILFFTSSGRSFSFCARLNCLMAYSRCIAFCLVECFSQ